jgi:hypothetical protein
MLYGALVLPADDTDGVCVIPVATMTAALQMVARVATPTLGVPAETLIAAEVVATPGIALMFVAVATDDKIDGAFVGDAVEAKRAVALVGGGNNNPCAAIHRSASSTAARHRPGNCEACRFNSCYTPNPKTLNYY